VFLYSQVSALSISIALPVQFPLHGHYSGSSFLPDYSDSYSLKYSEVGLVILPNALKSGSIQ